jgi:hypothetical protein
MTIVNDTPLPDPRALSKQVWCVCVFVCVSVYVCVCVYVCMCVCVNV